jgi:cytochrome b pre-mRNA-processing protein 3
LLKFLSRRRDEKQKATALYNAVVAQARLPGLYERLGVPDTLDGRVDAIVLHLALVLRRLRGEEDGKSLSQRLFDCFLADMDAGLRLSGVSDVRIAKEMKKLVKGVYGRLAAYDEALDGGDDELLQAAISRNLYGTLDEEPSSLVLAQVSAYVRALLAELEALEGEGLLRGELSFGSSPLLS